MGASGNRHAILHPYLSAYRSKLSMFMLHAFLQAIKTYKPLLERTRLKGQLTGILQLAADEKLRASFDALAPWLKQYPALACVLDAQEASHIAGIKLPVGGLFISEAGWIDSPDLCRAWAQSPNIFSQFDQDILTIDYDE